MTTSLTGALCGLTLGAGLFCLWWSMWETPAQKKSPPAFILRTRDQLRAAGLHRVSPAQLFTVCVGCGLVVAMVTYVFSPALPIAVCFGFFATVAPYQIVKFRARKTSVSRRTLWPEAIDHLSSGVRAGLSLPEAVCGLSARGPVALRPLFEVFAREYRATGSFSVALNRFKESAADPVADRMVATLHITREVGGTDLGAMLKTLSQFLREDARTRAELTARQSWTVTGAKLGVAAPWVVLGLLATRPETADAYNTAQGTILLVVGLVISLCAYSVMKRIGRLPEEARVLR